MARYNFEVQVKDTTSLQNVQNIVINSGRSQIQDPFRVGTATIQGTSPNLLPTLVIGDKIEINCVSPFTPMFYGTIADIKIDYGFVANADTWTIYCEDNLAKAGRALTPTTGSINNGATTVEAAVDIGTQSGVSVQNIFASNSTTKVSGQTLANKNLLSVLQELVFTEQGRLVNIENGIAFYTRNDVGLFNVASFSDGTLTATNPVVPFDRVQFYSQADSYFTKAVVEPAGLASQSSGSGSRVFSGASYNQTTADAANLATYVLATLTVNNQVPQMVACNSERQTNDAALVAMAGAGRGIRCEIILRGSRYQVFLEGGTMTATPEQTLFVFDVVSSAANDFFILDSTTFGILDTNRLGL